MSSCSEHRRQRGDILLEALVGLAVAALIAGGMTWLTGRVMSGQREARVMHAAMDDLARQMLREGPALCDVPPTVHMPFGDVTATLADQTAAPGNCAPQQATVTIDGRTHTVNAPRAVVLDLSPDDLELAGGAPFRLGTRQ